MFAHDPLNIQQNAVQQSEESLPPNQNNPESDNGRLERARQYSRIRIKLSIISTILFFVVTLLLVSLGITEWMEEAGYGASSSPYIALIIFALIFGVVNSVITFPLKVYSGYILEHRFGLSNQSFISWIWDGIKGMLVGAVIGTDIVDLLLFSADI